LSARAGGAGLVGGLGGGAAKASRLAGVRRPWEAGASSSPPPASSPSNGDGARWDTAFEAALADRLLELARAGRRDGSPPPPPPLTVQLALSPSEGEGRGEPPPQRLTW
jgi:hypothetical protein